MDKLRGTGVALITPFKEDFLVDYQSLENLIEFNIDNGIDYFVVMGTTAESATLSAEEKEKVTAFIVKKNRDRLPLIIGIGGNNTYRVVQEVKTTDLSPFAAILSVSPYYNKPSQEGMYHHFKAIAQNTNHPIILYNVPSRTGGQGLLPKTTIRLAKELNNIIAIKEASGDITLAMELIKNRQEGFLVLSGDDLSALPLIYLGGDGVISVIGGGIPSLFSSMINHAIEGNLSEANALHYKCLKMIRLIFQEGNPAGIKELLVRQGVISTNQVRLPLVCASPALRDKIKLELKQLLNR